MRILLDTHAFLWWISDAPELSTRARRTVTAAAECYLSVASCWEMAIKVSLGKLKLAQSVERLVPEQLRANDFRLLDLDFRHVCGVETLPFHHRDPFDRLLVSQALCEKLVLVSADANLSAYGIKRTW